MVKLYFSTHGNFFCKRLHVAIKKINADHNPGMEYYFREARVSHTLRHEVGKIQLALPSESFNANRLNYFRLEHGPDSAAVLRGRQTLLGHAVLQGRQSRQHRC